MTNIWSPKDDEWSQECAAQAGSSKKKKKEWPLHAAAKVGDLEAVKSIILAKRDASTKEEKSAETASAEVKAMIDELDIVRTVNGKTPLHYAAEHGHLEVMKFLVDNGADVNAQDKDGATPLHLAVGAAASGDREEVGMDIVKVLAHNGADVNLKDHSGMVPFHRCFSNGNPGSTHQVVEYLLLLDGGAHLRSTTGESPQESAAQVAAKLPGTRFADVINVWREAIPDSSTWSKDIIREDVTKKFTDDQKRKVKWIHAVFWNEKKSRRREVSELSLTSSLKLLQRVPAGVSHLSGFVLQGQICVTRAKCRKFTHPEESHDDARLSSEQELLSDAHAQALSAKQRVTVLLDDVNGVGLLDNALPPALLAAQEFLMLNEEFSNDEQQQELESWEMRLELLLAKAKAKAKRHEEAERNNPAVAHDAPTQLFTCRDWHVLHDASREYADYEDVKQLPSHHRIFNATLNDVRCVLKRHQSVSANTGPIVEKEIRVKRRVRKSPFVLSPVDGFVHVNSDKITYVVLHFEKLTPLAEAAGTAEFNLLAAVQNICRGLEQLHALGVVHGDLKIENAYMRADGLCCIGDFSESVLRNTATVTRQTVSRMAPEKLEWNKALQTMEMYPPDIGSDLLQLGGLIRDLLAKSTSDDDDQVRKMLEKLVEELRAEDPTQRPLLAKVFQKLQEGVAKQRATFQTTKTPLYWKASEETSDIVIVATHKLERFLSDSQLSGIAKLVRNKALWKTYRMECSRVVETTSELLDVPTHCKPAQVLPQLDGETSRLLDVECHETYLLHGTSRGTAEIIAEHGFDHGYSGALTHSPLFGHGTYFTDDVKKALRYAKKHSEAALIVARVVLGNVACGDDGKPMKASSLTCNMRRPQPVPPSNTKCLYDSVCGVHGNIETSAKEYVVYRHLRAYPEFIIQLQF